MPNSTIPSDAPISEEEKQRLKDDNIKRKLALPVVKLSIGAGAHFKQPFNEWLNHDGVANDHIDIVSEFDNIPLPDACVDFLELGDVVEHTTPWEDDKILTEWFRLLKVGAKVRIGTPNFHRAMTEYTLHTLFGESMPSGWLKLSCTDQNGVEHKVDYHIMAVDPGIDALEAARRKIYAWGINRYEQHYHLYTMETLNDMLVKYGFTDIDFSDSPPQELKDPKNSWWFVVTATYKGKS